MAVPFNVPDASAPAAATSSTSSATPQPQNPRSMPMNVVNSEYLVQALCEALYRYSRAGGLLTAPPSPSSTCTSYGNGEMFFNFDDIYGLPRRHRSHSLSIPPSSQSSRTAFLSQGHEMTDDEDDLTDDNFFQPHNIEEHYINMTLREQMREFPGRVPETKKKKTTATVLGNLQQQLNENKPKERKFAWSSIVALGVFAVGCGLLATRRMKLSY